MDIFINSEKSPALIQAKATGSPLSGFKVKRGAVVPLTVTVLGAQNATGLRMGIKAKGNYEGDLLILAEAAAGAQTELGTRFDLSLVASSLALNDALDVGEGKESSPATLAAMTEFAWMENGETRLSDTLQTTIINDIIRLARSPVGYGVRAAVQVYTEIGVICCEHKAQPCGVWKICKGFVEACPGTGIV